MNIKWEAQNYTDNFSFVPKYGAAVMELLTAAPGSLVLDLGCGSGALTAKLRDKGYEVIGMDASPELIALAKKEHPDLEFRLGDAVSFNAEKPFDAVFSNAVFHWIDASEQPKMLKCVCEALKPQGELVFEMGGHGNNALIHLALNIAFDKHGLSYKEPFYFPRLGEYAALVEKAGFEVRCAVLFDRPTTLKGPDGMCEWIKLFVKKPFEGLKEELKAVLIAEAVDYLKPLCLHEGVWTADYVRLKMRAVKRAAS